MQNPGYLYKNTASYEVSEPVVDFLEIIHIHENHRKVILVPAGPFYLHIKGVIQVSHIEQVRQFVIFQLLI